MYYNNERSYVKIVNFYRKRWHWPFVEPLGKVGIVPSCSSVAPVLDFNASTTFASSADWAVSGRRRVRWAWLDVRSKSVGQVSIHWRMNITISLRIVKIKQGQLWTLLINNSADSAMSIYTHKCIPNKQHGCYGFCPWEERCCWMMVIICNTYRFKPHALYKHCQQYAKPHNNIIIIIPIRLL